MKGLLIKDLKLLKGQERFFAIIVLAALAMTIFWKNALFVVSYVTLVFAIFAGSTIAYDEQNNGMTYLFTLPFTKKDYVKEKYLFGLLISVIPWAAISVIVYILEKVRAQRITNTEILTSVVMFLVIALCTMAVMIPAQLKFGSEKSRFAIIGCFLFLVLIGVAVTKTLEWMGVAWQQEVNELLSRSPGQMIGIVAGICALVLLISYLISQHIMQKKEF